MFGDMFGGDKGDINFLCEYLKYKGILNDNVITWIKRSSGLFSEKKVLDIVTDEKSTDGVKKATWNFVENISFEKNQEILMHHLKCKKCSGKVEVKEGVLINQFVCENCGKLEDREEMETNQETFKAALEAYFNENGIKI